MKPPITHYDPSYGLVYAFNVSTCPDCGKQRAVQINCFHTGEKGVKTATIAKLVAQGALPMPDIEDPCDCAQDEN